jgi:transposase-like protein
LNFPYYRKAQGRRKKVTLYLNKAIELIDTQICFVEKQLQWATVKQKCPLCTSENTRLKLQWTAKTVDYVE